MEPKNLPSDFHEKGARASRNTLQGKTSEREGNAKEGLKALRMQPQVGLETGVVQRGGKNPKKNVSKGPGPPGGKKTCSSQCHRIVGGKHRWETSRVGDYSTCETRFLFLRKRRKREIRMREKPRRSQGGSGKKRTSPSLKTEPVIKGGRSKNYRKKHLIGEKMSGRFPS